MINCGNAADCTLTLPLVSVMPSQLPPLLVVTVAVQFCEVADVVLMVIVGSGGRATPTTPCKVSAVGDTVSVPVATALTVSFTGTPIDEGVACVSVMVIVPL